jgi:hypothetical protein
MVEVLLAKTNGDDTISHPLLRIEEKKQL